MQPLTHNEWGKHYTTLRPYFLEEFPDVDANKLDAERGDWDGLVALIQRSTGMSADLVVQRLRKLDVSELGIGTGGDGKGDPNADSTRASLSQLNLGDGFTEDDRTKVVERLGQLNRRLQRFPAQGTVLTVTVKNRQTPAQHVRLELSAPHYAPIVATSHETDLMAALADVRQDMIRRINDIVGKRKDNR